jgi:hypothetical protein
MLEGLSSLIIAKLVGGAVAIIVIILGVNLAKSGGFPFGSNESSKKDTNE